MIKNQTQQNLKMKNITFGKSLGKKYSVKTERIIKDENGYAITRGSSYGAEVICTKDIVIIDIDYQKQYKKEDHVSSVVQKCKEFIENNSKSNLRLYITAGGMRVFISGSKKNNRNS